MNDESAPLLRKKSNPGLGLLFTTLCIIDIFGVFPIITLPRTIVQCGMYAIPLLLGVILLQIYTAILLGKSWLIVSALDPQFSEKNRYPLAAVTEITLGPKFRTIVTILLDLSIFGAGIPNFLVASQNLQLFLLKVSENKFNVSFCYWLLIIGILMCPLMWLGSPRDMKWLATCSAVTVCLTAMLIWWTIIFDNRELNVLPVPTTPSIEKLIAGYGMLAFQFDVHPTLMTVQVDMKKPNNIHKAVVLSFLGISILFGFTTALSVWRYGGSTTANVLQAVPSGYAISAVILISALQLCFSSCLGHSALFQHLEEKLHVERTFGWKRIATRSAVVCLAIAVGESVPRFDIVMSLIGGTLTGPLIFIFPPLIYSQAVALKKKIEGQFIDREVLSGTKRYIYNGTPSHSRIHSRSVHFGFSSDTDDNKKQENYAYVYYDREIHADEYSDTEDDQLFDTKHQTSRKSGDTNAKTNGCLILLEASEINKTRRVEATNNRPNIQSCFSMEKLMEYFGYFVVLFGVLITISSTYINVKNTTKFVKFTPPCIFNATVRLNLL